MEKISMAEPDLTDVEAKYVLEALWNNELSGHGRHVNLFEERFAEFIGVKYATMVPNGTISVHLALATLGIGHGDEVILPSQQISTVAFCITQLGATIVEVDVEKDTCVLDCNKLREAITPRTRVIIPTPIYGGVCPNYYEINKIVKESGYENISIIEDFAEAIGSMYDGNMIGSFGDIGCCSMFANKSITSGEGGVLTTNSSELDERIKFLRNCAYNRGKLEDRFLAYDLGFNYRPSNLQAAIGLGQLDRIKYLLYRRNVIHEFYRKYLSDKFVWQMNTNFCYPVIWMNTIFLPDNCGRHEFMSYMNENGIQTRPTFPPIGFHPYLQDYKNSIIRHSCENSEYIWRRGVLLPSGGAKLTGKVVKHICDIANKFLES